MHPDLFFKTNIGDKIMFRNNLTYPHTSERWPSGLRRTIGNRVYRQTYRGFESPSLRQILHRELFLRLFVLESWYLKTPVFAGFPVFSSSITPVLHFLPFHHFTLSFSDTCEHSGRRYTCPKTLYLPEFWSISLFAALTF
jgi:hypothetical protein